MKPLCLNVYTYPLDIYSWIIAAGEIRSFLPSKHQIAEQLSQGHSYVESYYTAPYILCKYGFAFHAHFVFVVIKAG